MRTAAIVAVVFGAFGIHIAEGGAFEERTAWAMALRSTIWILVTVFGLGAVKSHASPSGISRQP